MVLGVPLEGVGANIPSPSSEWCQSPNSRRQKKVSVHYLRYVISTVKAQLHSTELVRSCKAWQHRTICALSTYPYSYLKRSRFANYSTRKINLYIHKATFLSLVKTVALLLHLFKYFSVSMFISLPFLTSLTFLLCLLSAVLIAVAFRHLATKPLFYFACFYFYFDVFSRRGYCCLAAIVLAAWVVVPFFASLRHF